jgi:hypothetical protein
LGNDGSITGAEEVATGEGDAVRKSGAAPAAASTLPNKSNEKKDVRFMP